MIGSINNVNTLKSLNSLKSNNVSFGKKKAYTTTTTVTEGQPKEKKGFFKKIGLAIVGFFGTLFAIGAITDKAKTKKAEGEKPQEDNKVAPEAEEEKVTPEATEEVSVVKEAPVEEVITEEDPVGEIVTEEAPVEEIVTEEAPVEETVNETPAPFEVSAKETSASSAALAIESPVVTAQTTKETPAKEGVLRETPAPSATVLKDTIAPEGDNKKQAQALLTAGVAGAMAKTLPVVDDGISAVEYADAQKAQLGIATTKAPEFKPQVDVKKVEAEAAHIIEGEEGILENAFEVSLRGEETAKDIKATLKEYRQYVKEADRNDFGDIQTKDGGIVSFEKRVEYPAGETEGIVDEAITKHTREKEKQEILTVTKLDAQGNLAGIATYVNGRIDSLTEYTQDGEVNTLQADDKGVLLAKGMRQEGAGFVFDEIMNFEYVGDVRRLISCAQGVRIENGVTNIETAYKYDNDNNLKEYAQSIEINPDNTASIGGDMQFQADNMTAGALLYNGDFSAFGKGIAAVAMTFENGEVTSQKEHCEYTVNV